MRKIGLLIGCNYKNTPIELKCTDSDILLCRGLLKCQNFSEIYECVNENCTRNNISKIISDIVNVNEQKIIFIYFTGHMIKKGETYHMLTNNSHIGESITSDDWELFLDSLKFKCNTKKVFFIIDSCLEHMYLNCPYIYDFFYDTNTKKICVAMKEYPFELYLFIQNQFQAFSFKLQNNLFQSIFTRALISNFHKNDIFEKFMLNIVNYIYQIYQKHNITQNIKLTFATNVKLDIKKIHFNTILF